ncbi:MAG: F0F1 ATP synthase subunit gamma [Micrococcaceae bacterium]
MGAKLRVYRDKIAATQSMSKMFNAMELIATSRIPNARRRVENVFPFANAITKAISAVSRHAGHINHPLTTMPKEQRRVAMLVMTSDRGMAGAFSSNVLKKADEQFASFKERGIQVDLYVYGRKAENYYTFRDIKYKKSWTGNTDRPTHQQAKIISRKLLEDFKTPTEHGGVDGIYIVRTNFVSMIEQNPEVYSLLPAPKKLLADDGADIEEKHDIPAEYEFEPSATAVLDALLPRYLEARVLNSVLQSAVSELAARQKAMKAATDNANELIKKYTRLANTARQAEITQELTEIIAGSDALGS